MSILESLFNIKLYNVELCFEFIVADIQDDGLLGIDFLVYHDIGEAAINFNASRIELEHETLSCIQIVTFINAESSVS